MNEQIGHLSSETLQAYLEDELADERTGAVQEHLAGCRRCASELEAWSLLFRELGSLPELAPTASFADRVMAELPGSAATSAPQAGLVDRLRALLTGRAHDAARHLSPDRIQELLDGALGRRARTAAESHLEGCGACRDELESWAPVFASLDALPRFAPSEGFRGRVMDALPAQPRALPARHAAGSRALAAARKLVPSTRKGWALVGGLAAAPVVGFLALFGAVVAHPLLTLGDLAAFAWWQAGTALQGGAGWALGRMVDSPVLYRVFELFEVALASPGLAAAGLALLWASMIAAAWIIYRNVITPIRTAGRHG